MSEKLQKIISLGVVTVLVALCVLLVLWGVSRGSRLAESRVVVKNTEQVKQALALFYKDQGRYPTVPEFDDRGSFGMYINQGSLPADKPSGCSRAIAYTILPNGRPQLTVCLSAGVSGFRAGNNLVVITQ